MKINQYICENYIRIENKEATWQTISDEVKEKFGEYVSSEACRKRYRAHKNRVNFLDI